MQDSPLGTGRISTVLNDNKELRTIVIGYAIAPQPQPVSTFLVGQNISTTAARTTDVGQKPSRSKSQGLTP